MDTAGTLALRALELYDAYTALPQDRGGPDGPKGRAHQAWLDAKAEAQAAPLSSQSVQPPEEGALRESAQRMADDYQVSSNYHPHHVLVQRKDFDDLCRALAAARPQHDEVAK